jgi:hypothetical protein
MPFDCCLCLPLHAFHFLDKCVCRDAENFRQYRVDWYDLKEDSIDKYELSTAEGDANVISQKNIITVFDKLNKAGTVPARILSRIKDAVMDLTEPAPDIPMEVQEDEPEDSDE